MSTRTALKLRAEDDQDLAIISACLRDAFASLGEMAYDHKARRYAAIFVRALWETAPPEDEDLPEKMIPDSVNLARMRTGLHFDHVSAVRFRHLDRSAPTCCSIWSPSFRHRYPSDSLLFSRSKEAGRFFLK